MVDIRGIGFVWRINGSGGCVIGVREWYVGGIGTQPTKGVATVVEMHVLHWGMHMHSGIGRAATARTGSNDYPSI